MTDDGVRARARSVPPHLRSTKGLSPRDAEIAKREWAQMDEEERKRHYPPPDSPKPPGQPEPPSDDPEPPVPVGPKM